MASKAPVKFILGTHTVGDSTKDPVAAFDSGEDVRGLLDAFYSRGYREIDSARNYSPHAPGTSEPRLGEAGAASRFVVHSKVRSGRPGDHEPPEIRLSVSQVLEDLRAPAVETMFLHVPDRQTPFGDTLRAIDDAFREGKFRKFGLSNYTAEEVDRIIQICEAEGYVKPSVYQGHYNAMVRGGEEELFPLLRKHNMAFFAYSPAAGGLFSGHTDTSTRWTGDHGLGQTYRSLYGDPAVQASMATVRDVTQKHGISGHEAALRWVAFNSALDGRYGDGVVFGVSKVEQMHKSLDALEEGPLPDEVAEAITAIYGTLGGAGPLYHL